MSTILKCTEPLHKVVDIINYVPADNLILLRHLRIRAKSFLERNISTLSQRLLSFDLVNRSRDYQAAMLDLVFFMF